MNLYKNEGREQPLQPPELECRDEDWQPPIEPAPILCSCGKAEPEDGCDQCSACLALLKADQAEPGILELAEDMKSLCDRVLAFTLVMAEVDIS